MLSEARHLLGAAAQGWWDDRAMSMGAAIAFYTLFSLAPVLLIAVAVAGMAFGREAAQGAVVAEIGGLIGQQSAESVQALIASAGNMGSGIVGTISGVVTFAVLATGAFAELQDDLNIIWRVKPAQGYGLASFIRTRVLSFALIVTIGFLLLASLAIDAGVSAISESLSQVYSDLSAALHVLNLAISLIISTILFALIFKVLPDTDIAWRDVWFGAVVTALLFSTGKFLIGLYLGQSNIASSYGAAASLITILLWIYYSSQILLFGAELTKAFAERRGSRAPPAAP